MLRFTLWGLYQYDNTLFDDVLLPDIIDKQICIDNIIDKSGDLYLYYQVPERAKAQITRWFEMHYLGFKRMAETLLMEYNPIENTDRHETEVISTTTSRTNKASGSDSTQASGSDSTTNTFNETVDVDNENTVSAFDSGEYQPHDKTESTTDTDNTNNGSVTYGRKDTNTYGRQDDLNGTDETRRLYEYHGNLGTMTNQYMIHEELSLRKYNLYDVIAEMFENDILIEIY